MPKLKSSWIEDPEEGAEYIVDNLQSPLHGLICQFPTFEEGQAVIWLEKPCKVWKMKFGSESQDQFFANIHSDYLRLNTPDLVLGAPEERLSQTKPSEPHSSISNPEHSRKLRSFVRRFIHARRDRTVVASY
ncbi:hypothetical protein CONPUDRAFT_154394 [Coniophora puteana RWD-64-598 SS2]|uniref:Uncharacterized protein n=1 Tax=Coniophora puteana (strain RWD-64-598) TaxID=741705 RepID=A0A5M3MMC1_CONPW|nr:uncharacterized protein CONPUDRAFT_154394 [Coniophora puteana RWD-64-598 SS2]EIW80362.1 hypothetical protein CONPUDRAFT_154394 [Coniophora puteana RWD-64-598 SS2]